MTKEEMIETYGLEYYTEHVRRMNDKNKERYRIDKKYRAKQDARQKRLYKENERYREASKKRQRDKYKNDPCYRQKMLDYMKERYFRLKAEKKLNKETNNKDRN